MVENLNDVVQAMDDAKPTRKRAPAKKSEETPAAPIADDIDIAPSRYVEHNAPEPETPSFPGCNTCRNFGNYPSWRPCCDCKHNPKNLNSFYQA